MDGDQVDIGCQKISERRRVYFWSSFSKERFLDEQIYSEGVFDFVEKEEREMIQRYEEGRNKIK
jgi:negative regulator of sigma E activity